MGIKTQSYNFYYIYYYIKSYGKYKKRFMAIE